MSVKFARCLLDTRRNFLSRLRRASRLRGKRFSDDRLLYIAGYSLDSESL